MRKSRFNEEQTVATFREVDATSVSAVARKHEVNEQPVALRVGQVLRLADNEKRTSDRRHR